MERHSVAEQENVICVGVNYSAINLYTKFNPHKISSNANKMIGTLKLLGKSNVQGQEHSEKKRVKGKLAL